MSPLSRRQFLLHSSTLGAGVAIGRRSGLLGSSPPRRVDGAAPRRARPATARLLTSAPPEVQSFVSRPDIHCVGVSVERPAGASNLPAYLFMGTRGTNDSALPKGVDRGLMICDLDGNLVWWQRMDAAGYDPSNFRVQYFQGRKVLTWWQGVIGAGYATAGSYVIADTSYRPILDFKAFDYTSDAHEFIITAQDNALVTAYDASQPVVIGHAQEIDLINHDLLFDWPSYPAVPYADSYTVPDGVGDYFHINSIDHFVDGTGDLLVSSRATWTIYRISRLTGEIVWRLGGMQSDFDQGPGATFAFQHDARVLPDGSGISLFDNASQPSPEKRSWGKVLDLDETAMTATLRQEFTSASPRIDSPSQGNTQMLPGGGYLVMWGDTPYFTAFEASPLVRPEAVLEGRLPPHATSYRTFLFDWVGDPPESEMALVVHAVGPGQFAAYVSWNGATEINYWELHAGRSAATVVPVGLAPKEGFESIFRFAHPGAEAFEATACSVDGTVLGRVWADAT